MNRMFLTALVLATMISGRPAAAIDGRDAHCRYKVANAARTYTNYLLQRISTCHQWRIKEKVSPAIDCNDPSTWSANGYQRGTELMQKTLIKITRLAESCRPIGGTPASVGYTACPAPCGAVTISSFSDVAACMSCLADSCAVPAAAAVTGTAPLPITHLATRCQQILARKLQSYTVKRAFLEAACQYNKELGKPAFVGLDCLDLDNPANNMHYVHERALTDLDIKIGNQCEPVDMTTEIDSCATTPAGAITCLRSNAAACADALFSASFP